MERQKAAQRTLEKRASELWFGARVAMVLPTPVPAVLLISVDEPPDTAYDAMHFIKSTEHYISSSELLQVATGGRGLTEEETGTLLAGLMGTRYALARLVETFDQAHLAPLVDRLSGTDEWSAALKFARHVLGLPLMNLDELEQEHASGTQTA